jgi:DnaJ domain
MTIQKYEASLTPPTGFTPEEWWCLIDMSGLNPSQLDTPGCAQSCARLFYGDSWRSGKRHSYRSGWRERWANHCGQKTEPKAKQDRRRREHRNRRRYEAPPPPPRSHSETKSRGPYAVLGLRIGATIEQAKKAYRRLAMQFHPDRNPDGLEKMKDINRAYHAIVR